MDIKEWYIDLNNKVYNFFYKKQTFIPFSSFILKYLKLPFKLKVIFNIIFAILTGSITYTSGFIIAQSIARNEMLSIITAYSIPIDYPDILYFYYGFIYGLLVVSSILPIVFIYFIVKNWENFILQKLEGNKFYKLKLFIIILGIIIVFFLGSYGIYVFNPIIPYHMLYQSKYPSVFEMIIKKNDVSDVLVLSVSYLRNEIFFTLQLPNALLSFLIFMFMFSGYLKKVKSVFVNSLIYVLFKVILIVAIIFILFSHTFYQWGSFGKTLAKFNLDYIEIQYYVYNKIDKINGIRIYQNDEIVIIRDGCNIVHTIKPISYHIMTRSIGHLNCEPK